MKALLKEPVEKKVCFAGDLDTVQEALEILIVEG